MQPPDLVFGHRTISMATKSNLILGHRIVIFASGSNVPPQDSFLTNMMKLISEGSLLVLSGRQ